MLEHLLHAVWTTFGYYSGPATGQGHDVRLRRIPSQAARLSGTIPRPPTWKIVKVYCMNRWDGQNLPKENDREIVECVIFGILLGSTHETFPKTPYSGEC